MKLRIIKKIFLIEMAMVSAVFVISCGGSSVESHKEFSSAAPCVPDSVTQSPCYMESSGAVVGTQIQGDVTSWSNPTQSTTVIASLLKGFYDGKSCLLTDSNLASGQILFGKTIFGVTGGFTGTFAGNILSQAYRDPGSVPVANHGDNQNTSSAITMAQETVTYAGSAGLPTTGGYNYRDIPDQAKDDEGYIGTSCKYAPRPAVNCGTSQATITDRIADCLNLNGTCSDGVSTTKLACDTAAATWTTTATWNGATQCNSGESTWKLVTRSASNKEVWQDQRTGLLWSSLVSIGNNWCQANGNTEAAPVTYYQSCNTTVAGNNDCTTSTTINGNGTIGNITGGTTSSIQTVRVIFSSPTSFNVVSSTSSGCHAGGAQVIGASAGSTKTYTNGNYCSFTITQGSTPFAANDKFFLKSTAANNYSCTPGASSNLQPGTGAISLCAEAAGLNPSGEAWNSSGYMTAKGGLGKNSTPAVSWRLPTIKDYRMADVNGIRFVMPDMGSPGNERPNIDTSTGGGNYEWSASVSSDNRSYSWVFNGSYGYVDYNSRVNSLAVRCVGR